MTPYPKHSVTQIHQRDVCTVHTGHQLVLTPVSHEQHEADQKSRKDEVVRGHLPTTCPVSAPAARRILKVIANSGHSLTRLALPGRAPWNASDARKYAPSKITDAERKKSRKLSLQLYIVLSRNRTLMVRYMSILGQDQTMQANN
jgi:hypothetical protein